MRSYTLDMPDLRPNLSMRDPIDGPTSSAVDASAPGEGISPHANRTLIIAIVLVLASIVGAMSYRAIAAYPKRFAVVEAGAWYRSGAPSPQQLAHLADRYGLERVICLLNPRDESRALEIEAERQAAIALGLEWVNIPLGGAGQHTAEQLALLESLMIDENPPATLVHCAAGVNRTGLALGLYRSKIDGWSYDQIYEELLANDFQDRPKHEQLRQALRDAASGN